MAARKSATKSARKTATPKEPAPPKPVTFKASFRTGETWRGVETEYYTNALSAEEAFPKLFARFREAHPTSKFGRLVLEATNDISFVP